MAARWSNVVKRIVLCQVDDAHFVILEQTYRGWAFGPTDHRWTATNGFVLHSSVHPQAQNGAARLGALAVQGQNNFRDNDAVRILSPEWWERCKEAVAEYNRYFGAKVHSEDENIIC